MPSAIKQTTAAVPNAPTSVPVRSEAVGSKGSGPGMAYEDHYHAGHPRDLLINVTGNDTFTIEAKEISKITATFSTSIMTGNSEANETWYDIWVDGDLDHVCVPNLTGDDDGAHSSSNLLQVSGETFVTKGVKAGDEVYNMDDYTSSTVVSLTETEITLADDIFTNGEEYKIRMLSPVDVDSDAQWLGMVYNNASGNLDDSGYARPELQKPAEYSESTGDFTFSDTDWDSTVYSKIVMRQSMAFSNAPVWWSKGVLIGSYTASPATYNPTVTGMSFGSLSGGLALAVSVDNNNTSGAQFGVRKTGSGNTSLIVSSTSARSHLRISFNVPNNKKTNIRRQELGCSNTQKQRTGSTISIRKAIKDNLGTQRIDQNYTRKC